MTQTHPDKTRLAGNGCPFIEQGVQYDQNSQ